MNDKEIRSLLDKYWEGESSLEEESLLRDYFTTGEVADEFISFRPLFTFFSAARSVKMNGKVAHLPGQEKEKGEAKIRTITWLKRVAAAIILAIGIFFISRKMQAPVISAHAYQDTYDDPEMAYQEFKKAMLYMSGKINKGVNTASQGINKMEPLVEIIN